jgi:hypothetical protein
MVGTGTSGLTSSATAAAQLTAWPNPNRGDQLYINLSKVDDGVDQVGIEFFDLYGKQVVSRMLPVQDGMLNSSLDLVGDMSSGVYLMRVSAGSNVTTERIIIQR